jgi:hypothetical protein
MRSTSSALEAARHILRTHGIFPDREDILQNASTLVVRFTPTLVARVVQDVGGPRAGTDWFRRENAVAEHLTRHHAPVIPLHPDLPPRPHMHDGFPMNFWEFVKITAEPLSMGTAGSNLARCHRVLRGFGEPMPVLSILEESRQLAARPEVESRLTPSTVRMLCRFLERGLSALRKMPGQLLHGDAHLGNVLPTERGLLWTDWEDAFTGPPEWDVASALWNSLFLENDAEGADAFLAGYRAEGEHVDSARLEACCEARAAVICVWYPLLYPGTDRERQRKLDLRLEWLAAREN